MVVQLESEWLGSFYIIVLCH